MLLIKCDCFNMLVKSMTQLKTIRHLGKETGTWTLNQNKEKSINSLVLSLCFSESYSQPGSMSEPENIAIFANLTLIKT